MAKRLFAMFLVLVMVLSMVPAVVLAEGTEVTKTAKAGTHTDAGHGDDCGVTSGWQEWTSATTLPASGKYYLTKDVTLDAEHSVTGDLTLCLNGYVIKQTATKRVMSIAASANSTLTICDCTAYTENGVYYAGAITGGCDVTASTGCGGIFVRRTNTLKLYDGRITGNSTQFAAAGVMLQAVSGSTPGGMFYMYGGEITNNTAVKDGTYKDGGAVYMGASTYFEMNGGTISGNKGAEGGGIFMLANSQFVMTDGVISGNAASTYGGAIHFDVGTCVADLRGGQITGNTAGTNGGGMQVAFNSATVKLSGDIRITGNKVADAENNVRLGNTGKVTVGTLGADALVGITVGSTRERVVSTNVITTDVSAQVICDDTTLTTFLGADGQLQIKDKPADPVEPPVTIGHKHTLCNDTGCADHTDLVEYQPWDSDNSLPTTAGNWYLTKDVYVTGGTYDKLAASMNICLNGFSIYRTDNRRVMGTDGNVKLAISDCTAKVDNGVYTAGKITGGNDATSATGGGGIFIRRGGTLELYDGCITGNTTTTSGGGVMLQAKNTSTAGGKFYMYGGQVTNNTAIKEGAYKNCGGVYMGEGTTFVMTGGTISGNKGAYGAGVHMAAGSCVLELLGGEITGNTAVTSGGGISATFSSATIKISGDMRVTGNDLQDGTANNLRLGNSGVMTIENLGANALVGFNAGVDRAVSNVVATDVSAQFPCDDSDLVTFRNDEGKLQVKAKVVFDHEHCICGKADCADTTHQKVKFNQWNKTGELPSSGNYCLTTDVTVTAEASVSGTLNLCLHGHKVTGGTGKGLRFFSTPGNGGEVINITDCTAKTEAGVYTAGGFYNNTNTHTGSGGGAIFIRAGGTLNFYEGIVSGNVSATGGAAFYIKGIGNFYGGLVTNNTAINGATYVNGGAIYCDNAQLHLYGTQFIGNEANYGGAIHNGGTSVIDVRGGKIADNIAHANGGGINAASATCDIKFSGEPVIMGNKLATGEASNVRLGNTGVMDVENLGENAVIGITAGAPRDISTQTLDYAKNFVSDATKQEVIYKDQVLHMTTTSNHKHCLCAGTSATGCEHEVLTFVEWDNAADLPDSGNYCLSVDVLLPAQKTISGELNLCLNGHTVTVAENNEKGRVFYVTTNGTLNLTDCTGSGKLTGATNGALLANLSGTNMTVNMYGGNITGNHARSTGGAVLIQGECTFNMYGGKITGNSATSYLKTDAEGNVLLSSNGNQSYQRSNAGAVYVYAGVFNMYGGEISGNTATPVKYLKAGATSTSVSGGLGGGVYFDGASTGNLYGGKITGNTADMGGAIIVTGSGTVLNLLGTEISGNTARNGGGIIMQSKGAVNMIGGKITGNKTTSSGAGIYVSTNTKLVMTGGEISANETEKNGGGMYVLSAEAELIGGKISGNKADSGAGVYSSVSTDTPLAATIYVKDNILITENQATGNGGGIMMSADRNVPAGEGSKIVMTGGEISKNSADNAGGILVQTNAALELSGGKVVNNSAIAGGGGVYISTNTKLTMTGGTISGNTSKGDAGGLYLLRCDATIKGGVVSGNSAANGGGVKVAGAKATINGLTVSGNKATGKINASTGKLTTGTGGGIWVGRTGYKVNGVQMYALPTVNIYSITVSGNHSTGVAGGILVQSKDTVFNMYGGTFSGNVAVGNGGAMYLSTNVKANITGGTFSGNKAKISGAIYVYNNDANISGIRVYGNESTGTAGAINISGKGYKISLCNAEIYNNVAGGKAGGVYVSNYAELTMENAKLYGNKSTGVGGALYFSNPGYGTVKNTEIYENESEVEAGGVYVGVASVATMENVTIRDNVGNKNYGGGIYNRGRVELKDCKILNNTINNGSGGGIGTFKTSTIALGNKAGVFVENSIISGNKADQQGGGVYAHRGCPVYLDNVALTDNTAAAEGGAVFADGRLGMTDVTVTGNTSGIYAVYLTSSEFDGHSYQTGHKRMGGKMIIKDNNGGDMYLVEGAIVAVTGEMLGEGSHVNVTLQSGVLSQWVVGAYNYEGGDLNYTITAGTRSLTDPEPIPQTAEEQVQEQEAAAVDTWLYVGIGVFVVAIAAVAVLVAKKKKAGKTAENATKE